MTTPNTIAGTSGLRVRSAPSGTPPPGGAASDLSNHEEGQPCVGSRTKADCETGAPPPEKRGSDRELQMRECDHLRAEDDFHGLDAVKARGGGEGAEDALSLPALLGAARLWLETGEARGLLRGRT